MFKSILNFLNANDPYGNWLNTKEGDHDLKIILATLYNWIDEDYIQETEEVNDYLYYINEKLK